METLGLDGGECGFGYGVGHGGPAVRRLAERLEFFCFESDWDILGHAPPWGMGFWVRASVRRC